MSSNPLNSTAENGKADSANADAKPTFSNGILHIPSSGPQQLTMVQSLLPLFGSPPTESPTWSGFAHQYPDGRGLPPLTIRYASSQDDDLSVQQQAQNYVRSAIWVTVERLLAGYGIGREALPLITFDEGPRTPTGGFGRVDLTFADRHAFSIVHDQLREIKIGENDQRGTYTLSAYTNNIDGTMFRVDVVNLPLPVNEAELNSLSSALTHLSSNIGTLLGVAKSVLNSPLHEAPVYAGLLRLYVKLDRSLMAVPLTGLVARLPTHMLWQGTRYALIYNGRYFHHGPRDSEDYHTPDSSKSVNSSNTAKTTTAEGAGTSAKASAAPQAPPDHVAAGGSAAAPAATSEASKKRKKSSGGGAEE